MYVNVKFSLSKHSARKGTQDPDWITELAMKIGPFIDVVPMKMYKHGRYFKILVH